MKDALAEMVPGGSVAELGGIVGGTLTTEI